MYRKVIFASVFLVVVFFLKSVTFGAASIPIRSTQGLEGKVKPFLVPSRIEWAQSNGEDYLLRITTKANIPKDSIGEAGWAVGIDLDAKRGTGVRWSRIGSDMTILIEYRNNRWEASYETQYNKTPVRIYRPVRIRRNQMELPIPLALLGYPGSFQWQLAVVKGNERYEVNDSSTVRLENNSQRRFSCH